MKPGKRPSAKGPPPDGKALAWLNDYRKVSRWMARYDVERVLHDHDGFCKIPDFLPPAVAEEALRTLECLPPDAWLPTEATAGSAETDYAKNVEHRFTSAKAAPGAPGAALASLLRAFTLLLPEHLHAFSAGRYGAGDGIAAHDDRAFTRVLMTDGPDAGRVALCSRDVTLVYHLTKGWTDAMGGALVDLESGRRLVPQFNSAVIFRVPRWHAVEPVAEGAGRPRFSVFGWFLVPGELYSLEGGGGGAEGAAGRRGAEGDGAGEGEESGAGPMEPARCKLARRIMAAAAENGGEGGEAPRKKKRARRQE